MWLLNAQLPRVCANEWILLYDSKQNGAAYNRLRSATQDVGATLMIIQDKVRFRQRCCDLTFILFSCEGARAGGGGRQSPESAAQQ